MPPRWWMADEQSTPMRTWPQPHSLRVHQMPASIDTTIGPHAVYPEVPEQDHHYGYGLGEVVAQCAPDVKDQTVQPQADHLVDHIATGADQGELGQRRNQVPLPRFGEGPQPVPDEVADHGRSERASVGPELGEPKTKDQHVQHAEIDHCPYDAHRGKFAEPDQLPAIAKNGEIQPSPAWALVYS